MKEVLLASAAHCENSGSGSGSMCKARRSSDYKDKGSYPDPDNSRTHDA